MDEIKKQKKFLFYIVKDLFIKNHKIIFFNVFIFFLGILFIVYFNHLIYKNNSQIQENIPKTIVSDKLSVTEYRTIDKQLIQTVQAKDPTAAQKQLQDLVNIDPRVEHYCHGLAHDIGHAALKKYGFSGALTYLNDICGSGYIHGIIEEYFANTKDIVAALKTVCNLNVPASQFGNCYHGVGHGLMFYTNNDIPKSLSYCSDYTDVTARSRCSEGVFMENFNSDVRFHPTKYLNKNNPFFPCPLQTTFYKDACYFYATDYYLILHPNQYTSELKWCDSAEKDFILTCDRGTGSRAMKYNAGSPKLVEKICNTANTQSKTNACIDGMISYFLVQYNSLSRANSICQTLEAKNQAACYEGVINRSNAFLN